MPEVITRSAEEAEREKRAAHVPGKRDASFVTRNKVS
jgi:hypothetical protein